MRMCVRVCAAPLAYCVTDPHTAAHPYLTFPDQKWLALSSSSNTGQLRDCTHTTASTNLLTPSPLYTVDSVNNLAIGDNWSNGQTTGDQACGAYNYQCLQIRDWACSPYNCGSPVDPSRMVLCSADCTPVPGYLVAPGYNNDYVDSKEHYDGHTNPTATAAVCTGDPSCAGFVFNPSTGSSWTKTNVTVNSHPLSITCIYTKGAWFLLLGLGFTSSRLARCRRFSFDSHLCLGC